jgi:dTDP-4-amino-4,6-dideoxygalactose transaminase
MRVPLLDLQAQYQPIRDEILAAMTRVADSQRFIMGPEIDALEQELAAMLGIRHAITVSSGTDALLLALMALDVTAGDEVITPTYSFFATAGCVSRLGARPVLVDIDPVTFNIDVSQAIAAITPRTKAIMPVHLFGQSADLDPILDATGRAGIAVVEDAAQAIGATYHARPVGGIGAFGCFSFFPSKNLGAFGDAGLVTTNDDTLADRARLLRTHGMRPKYYHHVVGANFRMDALQAAILRVKAPQLPAWTDARRANAATYRDLFGAAGLVGAQAPRGLTPSLPSETRGQTPSQIVLPVESPGCRHIYNQFVIRTSERDALKRHLDAEGIGNEIYYPVPFHLQPCFADLGYSAGAFPHAERAAAESLAIPIYGELTRAQQERVVSAIGSFVHRKVGAAR